MVMLIYIDAFNPSRLIPSLVHMSQEKRKGSVTPSLTMQRAALVQQEQTLHMQRMQMQMQHMFMMSAVMGMGMAPPGSSGSSKSSPSIGFPTAAMHFGGFPAPPGFPPPPGLMIKKEEEDEGFIEIKEEHHDGCIKKGDGCIEIKEEHQDDAEEGEGPALALAVDVGGAEDKGEEFEEPEVEQVEEPEVIAEVTQQMIVEEEEQVDEEQKADHEEQEEQKASPFKFFKPSPKAVMPPWAKGTKRTRPEHAIQDDGLKPNPMIICS